VIIIVVMIIAMIVVSMLPFLFPTPFRGMGHCVISPLEGLEHGATVVAIVVSIPVVIPIVPALTIVGARGHPLNRLLDRRKAFGGGDQ
jgi:hypothetical protein